MPRLASLCTLLLRLLCPAIYLGLSTATCYYPNGSPATGDVQCQSGPNSACCGQGAICLSNGLCLGVSQPFGLSRGSCTDPNFEIDECPKACTNVQLNGGCTIVMYNNTAEGSFYCCNSIQNNNTGFLPRCAWDLDPFTLSSATIVPGVALLENYEQASTTTNNTIETPLPSNSTETPLECPKTQSSNNDVAIGAGVGVPLGVLALLAVAWALLERQRRAKYFQSLAAANNSSVPLYSARKQMNPQELFSGPAEPAELGGNRIERR
ncbi:hypothetical protein ASPCAL12099 [Aspergillus calidoustus]|uniref:Mid2 domain-containing protein n=1 Tax=Aspergillus calidoustus TaxID=454130 RepID=A0A0U5GB71_ASPCI|nr:hypothetical protein ASPCAL12099 [Aspergillus calidoustus]